MKKRYKNKISFRRSLISFFFVGCFLFSALIMPALCAADDEIASFDQEENASFDSEPTANSHDHTATASPILHVDHYHPPGYFPERLKRTVDAKPWMHIFPFILLIILSIATTHFWGRRRQNVRLARKRVAWGKITLVVFGLFLITVFSESISNALTYSSVKDAVVSFVGEGKKIYQTHIDVTPEVKQKFKNELKWEPKTNSIKAYYSKSADGTPEAYVFVLSDKLAQCGGLHKYCVKVNAAGDVQGVKILELTCDRSYIINNKSFLNQFKSYSSTNADKKKCDIISGATYSADLTNNIVRRALILFELIKGHSNA